MSCGTGEKDNLLPVAFRSAVDRPHSSEGAEGVILKLCKGLLDPRLGLDREVPKLPSMPQGSEGAGPVSSNRSVMPSPSVSFEFGLLTMNSWASVMPSLSSSANEALEVTCLHPETFPYSSRK